MTAARKTAKYVLQAFIVPPLGGFSTSPPPKGGTTNEFAMLV
jgi:hypothetical protein